MAIREPLLKLGTQGGKVLIRVDSISDIVFLDQNDPTCSNVKWSFSLSTPPSPTVDELKKIGNSHFSRGDWLLAVFAYSKGLRLDKNAFLLRLNRAEAYLRLSYYSAALFDAETVLASDLIDTKSRWKALFRAAKALYFQGNYSAARDKFEEAKNVEEDGDESKQWFERIDKREEELEHGRFDWARLFMESLKSPHIQHIADFRGSVKVESMPDRGGGRGVIATAPVQVGQLLVSKHISLSSLVY
jgi:tetratricopeptide (TPR) repeat protein